MKIDTDKEPCFFEEFNPEDMEKIIDTQHKVIEYQKKHKMKKLFGILCILDDISDDPRVSRHNKLLNSLYVRGKHNNISIITSVQRSQQFHQQLELMLHTFSFSRSEISKRLKYYKMNYLKARK